MLTETQQYLLDLTASQLFHKRLPLREHIEWAELIREARQQAVFPLVYAAVSDRLPEPMVGQCRAAYYNLLGTTVRNAHQHGQLHRLLCENAVPYVIIKGMASAAYYPDPFLRTMGDVDFLVDRSELSRVSKLLHADGFSGSEKTTHRAHLVYRKPGVVLEMHWEPNGLPEGEKGDLCRDYLKEAIATAKLYTVQGESFNVPDPFSHGLIVLLHTALHLINTGIGLRHLCDWAVFAGSMDSDTFRATFEEKLQAAGLWRFAQLLTQVSIRYLGCPEQEWAIDHVDEELLGLIIEDVLKSGNFGEKDAERLNEAKLMTTVGSGTVRGTGPVRQFFSSLSEKAKQEMPACKKATILLPAGWVKVLIHHARLVSKGKRPKIHPGKMLSGAGDRSRVYREFQLFQ